MAVCKSAMESVVSMKHQFNHVYSGKRVLVTGHTGFKGSWLSLWLSKLGAEVYGYALDAPTDPSLFDEADVASTLTGHEVGDIRDRDHLKAYLEQVQPEIVFHLAAQPLVRLSYDEPAETFETNVMGTVNLLEAVRNTSSVQVCQVITSDKCYENREWVYAYRENDPMGGYDPYSNSKGCSELVVSSYRQSFFHPDRLDEHGVSLSSVRAGNVIGGGDWALDRIIPDCIRALEKKEPINLRNPHAIRPWQHVLEPLSGYLWLAAKQYLKPGAYEEGWNFGPGSIGNVPVSDIAAKVVKEWGRGSFSCDLSDADKVHEARFLKLDITKANDLLDWHPVNSVNDSIEATVVWYLARSKNTEDLQSMTMKQISEYSEKAARSGVEWAMNKDNQ